MYRRQQNFLGPTIAAFFAGIAAWALFGDKFKEKIRSKSEFSDLKRTVMDKVANISDMTREKYDSIVEETAANYARVKDISQNELQDLIADLKFHWYRIKYRWTKD